jgi:hypothetical protein
LKRFARQSSLLLEIGWAARLRVRRVVHFIRHCSEVRVASPEGMAILLLTLIAAVGGIRSIPAAGAAGYATCLPPAKTACAAPVVRHPSAMQ